MTIAILGGCGFVGKNLVRHLLVNTNHTIHALCPHPETMGEFSSYGERFAVFHSDVFATDDLTRLLQGSDVVYYFVHMMDTPSVHFYDAEARAAHSFAEAVRNSHVPRVVYLSGLGKDTDHLSEHLKSRHNTGDILRGQLPLVVEFRASMILGTGSASYEIIRGIVEHMPVMVLPRWTRARTQPIGLADVLSYLTAAIDVPLTQHEIVEVGGPEIMSYKDCIVLYAKHAHKHRTILCVPIVPEWLAGWWLNMFLPKETARVGRHMFSSLRHETVVTNNRAQELFPQVQPTLIQSHLG